MQIRNEGAGFVRMSNGRRIHLHAFREAMDDRAAATQPSNEYAYLDDLYQRIGTVEVKLKKRQSKNGFDSALDRAAHDREKGRLPTRKEVPLTHHSAEDDLWK
jgi:hypothetical protein